MDKYSTALSSASTQLELIPAAEDLPEFDWNGPNDSIVLQEQPETAIYLNPKDVIVIRQRASAWDEEDSFVYIAPHNLMTLIDRLCDLAGVPEVGKR
jgi:hypothetical protein